MGGHNMLADVCTRDFMAFCHSGGLSAAGNPCRLFCLTCEPGSPPASSTRTQCATWPAGRTSASVRCWTGDGRLIQCCGHGLLSAAASWRAQWPCGGELLSGGTRIRFVYEESCTWLGFSFLQCEPQPVPRWTADIFGSRPIAAARAGPESGYLVLVWPQGSDLRELASPGSRLATKTGRAVIACCAVSEADSFLGETIRLRYFAPQYGVDEDSATGSAMRILASYWAPRFSAVEVVAWQQSALGGLLRGRVDGDMVWIGGEVDEIGG